MVAGYVVVVIALLLYLYALWIALQSRSPEAILSWGVCVVALTSLFVVMSMYGLGWITHTTYTRIISPLILPTIAATWILPTFEWIVRMLKANKAIRRH